MISEGFKASLTTLALNKVSIWNDYKNREKSKNSDVSILSYPNQAELNFFDTLVCQCLIEGIKIVRDLKDEIDDDMVLCWWLVVS